MRYKLNLRKGTGFNYSVEDGVLKIGDILIEEPTSTNIVDYELDLEMVSVGITGAKRVDGELIVSLDYYVEDIWPYVSGSFVRNGKKGRQISKWDLTVPMTADEIINGNMGASNV